MFLIILRYNIKKPQHTLTRWYTTVKCTKRTPKALLGVSNNSEGRLKEAKLPPAGKHLLLLTLKQCLPLGLKPSKLDQPILQAPSIWRKLLHQWMLSQSTKGFWFQRSTWHKRCTWQSASYSVEYYGILKNFIWREINKRDLKPSIDWIYLNYRFLYKKKWKHIYIYIHHKTYNQITYLYLLLYIYICFCKFHLFSGAIFRRFLSLPELPLRTRSPPLSPPTMRHMSNHQLPRRSWTWHTTTKHVTRLKINKHTKNLWKMDAFGKRSYELRIANIWSNVWCR